MPNDCKKKEVRGDGGGGGREVIVELTTKVSGGGIKKKMGYLTLSLINLIRISPP